MRDETRFGTSIWALLLALPLVVIGLITAQLVDADYIVGRQRDYAAARRNADRLETAVSAKVVKLADSLNRQVLAGQSSTDPNLVARSLIYANEASAVLVRRGGRQIFPPDGGWDLTADKMTRAKALEAAVDLQRKGADADGWLADAGGLSFFRCQNIGATEICASLDWAHVGPPLRAALAAAASSLSGWSFAVRDPFDQLVWGRGDPPSEMADVFVASGAMRGWRIAVAGSGAPSQGTLGRIALAVPIAVAWLALVWATVRRQKDRIAELVARNDLNAKLSHDLRTPLANLKLYAELIARQSKAGAPGHGRVGDYCQVLGEEIDRLDVLVGATMAPAHDVSRDIGVPDDVVRKTIARLDKLLAASGCRCEVDAGAGRSCGFDRPSVERILVNLIDNARKHAPGAIRVSTALDGDSLCLSVRDWGNGFVPAPPRARGSGLGLSVVRDLARANGGRVVVIDCRPGSRVDVTLKTTAVDSE